MKRSIFCLSVAGVFLVAAAQFLIAPAPAAVPTPPAPISNSIGLKLVRIPPGEFIMGSLEPLEQLEKEFPQYEIARFDDAKDEYPAHKVRITKSFYMGIHAVTVGQFRKFVDEHALPH